MSQDEIGRAREARAEVRDERLHRPPPREGGEIGARGAGEGRPPVPGPSDRGELRAPRHVLRHVAVAHEHARRRDPARAFEVRRVEALEVEQHLRPGRPLDPAHPPLRPRPPRVPEARNPIQLLAPLRVPAVEPDPFDGVALDAPVAKRVRPDRVLELPAVHLERGGRAAPEVHRGDRVEIDEVGRERRGQAQPSPEPETHLVAGAKPEPFEGEEAELVGEGDELGDEPMGGVGVRPHRERGFGLVVAAKAKDRRRVVLDPVAALAVRAAPSAPPDLDGHEVARERGQELRRARLRPAHVKERAPGEIAPPERERQPVRGRSRGREALDLDRRRREVRVHRRREAHERLSRRAVVEPRAPLDAARLPSVREAHHRHRRNGLDQGRREKAEGRERQLARLRLDEETKARGKERGALHDPLHVRIAGAPGADVELARDVRVPARELAPLLAERVELGEVRLDEGPVHHVPPATGRARLPPPAGRAFPPPAAAGRGTRESSSTRAPSPPSRRGTSTRSRSVLQPSAYVFPSIS